MGNLLSVHVHSAAIHDTVSGVQMFKHLYHKYATIEAFCADVGYCGTSAEYVKKSLRLDMQISKKIAEHGFKVLPKRWVVERTFA